ncbi:MAG: sigma 54-interacting transcriptional regulator, partial [Planctomycetota bacterium]
IRNLKALIQQLAPADVSVLILGETGTGKELAARHIHDASTRPGAIQIIDCSALPSELVASELFGYRSGAFSGAEKDHDGILVQAAGGTLLIDEIGEASLDLQGKLLRVLDRRTVRPLGAEEEQTIDARLLFTTNSDLESRVSEGSFRRDLYYRIAACTVEVPPLRERLEDLPLLIEHFLSRLGSDETGLEISNGAMRLLSEYPWPGNVRELDNVITRLGLQGLESADVDEVRMLLGEHNVSRCFSPALLRSRPLVELSRQLEFEYMVELYRATSGDLELLGQRLGISRQAVYKRLKAIGANPSALRRAVAGEAVELEKPNGRA